MSWGPAAPWTRASLQKLPPESALRVALRLAGSAGAAFTEHAYGPGPEHLQAFINGPNGDARHLERLDLESQRVIEFGDWRRQTSRELRKGDLLRSALQVVYPYDAPHLTRLPRQALWPYLSWT